MTDYFSFKLDDARISELSNLSLAHMGDAVYELMVRAWAPASGACKVNDLHRIAVGHVSAPAQAKAAQRVLPILTEAEQGVFRRARNAHVGGIPHGSTVEEYHLATALEAVFGWLYYKGMTERINALFAIITEDWENGT